MVYHEDKKWMKKEHHEKSDDLVWERLLKIVREIIRIRLKKEVTKNRQGWGFDGKIGVQKDPIEIGDLIEGRFLIYIDLWFGLGRLHRLPSILFHSHLFLYSCSYRHVIPILSAFPVLLCVTLKCEKIRENKIGENRDTSETSWVSQQAFPSQSSLNPLTTQPTTTMFPPPMLTVLHMLPWVWFV